MIQNERQYKVTQTKLRELERDLALLEPPDPNIHPRQVIARRNSLNLLIGELDRELTEYERLKSGNVKEFAFDSLKDLPVVMIKARIASGLTQKELAEKMGLQEQQIQRYEANHYHAVGFDRLQAILQALNVNFVRAVVSIDT